MARSPNRGDDWRAATLSKIRALIKQAEPGAVEEVKWRKPSNPAGVPVWSHGGPICTGETYKSVVKLTFFKGAQLKDPKRLFNSGLEGNVRRAIDLREGDEIDATAFKALIREAVELNTGKETTMPKAKAKKKVPHMPKGYQAVTPYLSIRGAAQAIDFYKKAFGAKEVMRMPGPDGKLGHAEVEIEGHRVMLSDEYQAMDFMSPQSRGGTTVHIHVYAKDVDRIVERAVAAGAKLKRPAQDQFYGDRTASLEDPFGHVWHVATHVEDLSMAELKKRAAKMAAAS